MQPFRAIQIATASTSHTLCSGTFISGRDPVQTYLEEMRPERGMGLLDWGLRYDVDRERRVATTTFAGMFRSRAVYHDRLGCIVVHPGMPQVDSPRAADAHPSPLAFPDLAKPPSAGARGASWRLAIDAAIDEAFVEKPDSAPRNTKAIVVVHRGQIVAEHYAAGVGVRTPLLGHSVSKSVTSALIGVLVRKGLLSPAQPVSIPQWQAPGDPRGRITVDQLLRMSSGLPWDEYAGGFDPATRMWFLETDMFAFATRGELEAPPGARWNYSNRGYMVLSRMIRDAAGGKAADVIRFAQQELFDPIGMEHVVMEFDATGTPLGTSHIYASARDWARFGLLYLDDGVVGGQRILPEQWVRASTTQTLDTGYGAGFWLNTLHTAAPIGGDWGLPGAPADTYFARGYLGQFVVVVPSQDLVVVRLGVSHRGGGDIAGVGRLVERIVNAVKTRATAK